MGLDSLTSVSWTSDGRGGYQTSFTQGAVPLSGRVLIGGAIDNTTDNLQVAGTTALEGNTKITGNLVTNGQGQFYSSAGIGYIYIGGDGAVVIERDAAAHVLLAGADFSIQGYLQVKVSTVALLPSASGIEGAIRSVNDAISPAALSAVTGGGSVHCLVFSNGTTWIVL